MKGLTQEDLDTRRRGQLLAATVLTIMLTGLVALGEPTGGEDEAAAARKVVAAPVAAAAIPPAGLASPDVYSPDQMPWQWEAAAP